MKFNTGLFDFIGGMLPSFNRSDIHNEIDRVMKDMDGAVLQAADVMRRDIEKTEAYALMNIVLKNNTRDYRGDVPEYLKKIINKALEERRDLDKTIERLFNKEVHREGLDYKRGHILHLISLIEYFNSFVMYFMLTATKESINDPFYPADKRDREKVMFKPNVEKFASICAALEVGFKKFDKLMVKVDGITLDEESRDIVDATVGKDVDPLKTGFYSVDTNPFYLSGKIKNSIYVWFFEFKQTQLEKLKLHVMKLNKQRDNVEGDTTALDKSIAYHSNRLNKLSAEIQEELDDVYDV